MFGSHEGFGGEEFANWKAPESSDSASENRDAVGSLESIPTIPESEYEIRTDRSSGAGGQNVNKVETKAVLSFCIGDSMVLSDSQKQKVREHLGNALRDGDRIVIHAQTTRSQLQNRHDAVSRLQEIIEKALTPRKERVATKVSRSQKRKRLDEKRIESNKKNARREPRGGW